MVGYKIGFQTEAETDLKVNEKNPDNLKEIWCNLGRGACEARLDLVS